MITGAEPAPLVLHVVHRFDTGGLENGLVNLVNQMPVGAYRHAIVALTEFTSFSRRVQRPDVPLIALHKTPGQGVWVYPRFLRLLRALRPAVVHTRNLGTLEFQLPAAMAGIAARVHGEHGRDIDDLDGSSRRNRWLRRIYRPFVHRHIALSNDLRDYLVGPIGIRAERVTQIYNGVDAQRFCPRAATDDAAPSRLGLEGCPFERNAALWVVGTVGRMQAVKAQTLLARAFIQALTQAPALRQRLRLVMVGDGPLRDECSALLSNAGLAHLAWLPGERSDIPDVMRALDGFVLPSLAEGVSNTILEAMASGLPVIATNVGANAHLVQSGITGVIVEPDDVGALAAALAAQADAPTAARSMGKAGRARAVHQFSMASMAASYKTLYDGLLHQRS